MAARTPPPEKRSQIRKFRYQALIDAGYSKREADRYKNWSSDSVQGLIAERKGRNVESVGASDAKLYTQNQRLGMFREWSSVFTGFPDWALQEIQETNDRVGRNALDSYGFRQFYYRFVQQRTPSVASRFADRGDS